MNSRLGIIYYNSYNIGLIFLLRLGSTLFENKKLAIDSAYGFFLGTICYEAECYDEWAKAIYHGLMPSSIISERQFVEELFRNEQSIQDPDNQSQISINALIPIICEFCRLNNEMYKNALIDLVIILEGMKERPHEYKDECELLQAVIGDVLEKEKFLCYRSFWNNRLRLGRFTEDTPENRAAIMELFSTPDNIIGHVDHPYYGRQVYLANKSDGFILWGYATKEILDAGIEQVSEGVSLAWFKNPNHEFGACFTLKIIE